MNDTICTVGTQQPKQYPEHELQKECYRWFCYQHPKIKSLLIHVPNEGKRHNGNRLRQIGMTAGVADMLLLLPKSEYGSLAIEFKSKYGKQSPAQREWMEDYLYAGNYYEICRSFEDFVKIINRYMS